MKTWFFPALIFAVFVLPLPNVFAAESATWAGEYADKKFLNGSAVFQLTIEQSGSKIQVSFDAVNNDGRGCAPETQTTAKLGGKDELKFDFLDNQGNAGTGRIKRSGDELIVSLKTTRVTKQDCTKFYVDGIRLKKVK